MTFFSKNLAQCVFHWMVIYRSMHRHSATFLRKLSHLYRFFFKTLLYRWTRSTAVKWNSHAASARCCTVPKIDEFNSRIICDNRKRLEPTEGCWSRQCFFTSGHHVTSNCQFIFCILHAQPNDIKAVNWFHSTNVCCSISHKNVHPRLQPKYHWYITRTERNQTTNVTKQRTIKRI